MRPPERDACPSHLRLPMAKPMLVAKLKVDVTGEVGCLELTPENCANKILVNFLTADG